MIRTSAFVATSIDGFIAREDGNLDWLDHYSTIAADDTSYREFVSTIDVIVMGRNTYEKVLKFDFWPYEGTPVKVLSTTLTSVSPELAERVEIMSCSPKELLEQLEAQSFRHAYIDGGKTIQSFLRVGMLDELTLTRIQILLGQGIPLFGPLDHDVPLKLVKSKNLPWGFVQSHYKVLK